MTTLALEPTPLRRDATVIGLVGVAHCISHFSQLLLPPLFPWLKDAFQVSYTQLGFLLTIFFVVSCIVQTLSGFWVDRYGPRPILFSGLGLLGVAALGYAASQSYWMLAAWAVVAGIGNGVFHPVDYTMINRRVAKQRLGHAYSVHGITGSLGWALAPALLVPITLAYSWRVALVVAAGLAFGVLALLWLWRGELKVDPLPEPEQRPGRAGTFAGLPEDPGGVDVLRLLLLLCRRAVHRADLRAAGRARAACGAGAPGGHLPDGVHGVRGRRHAGGRLPGADPERAERIVGVAFGLAALVALAIGFTHLPAMAVPVLFGAMGFVSGMAGPSRDLLVKRSAPDNATGRVYGVVYSGLDIGQAVVPLVIGTLMDHGAFSSVWLALALLQGVLIVSAFNVRRVRRTALQPAAA